MATCDLSNPCPTCKAEEWRPVVGMEGVYEVSSLGRVWRVKPPPKGRWKAGRVLAGGKSKVGYPIITLYDGKRRLSATVHRLVMAAFVGLRPAGYQVNHLNFDRTDNRLCNLEYTTPLGNTHHSLERTRRRAVARRGRSQPGSGAKGEAQRSSRLTTETALEILRLYAEDPKANNGHALAVRLGVNPVTVYRVIWRESWKHLPGADSRAARIAGPPRKGWSRSRGELLALPDNALVGLIEATVIAGVAHGTITRWAALGFLEVAETASRREGGRAYRRFRVGDVRRAAARPLEVA